MQKHQLRPLHLNLSLNDSHIEQVHEHRHLGVISDDEFRRPHITGTCKTVLKKSLSVVTAQTLCGHS